jgi:D-alanyl-D-alanine carboxypeptidase
MAKRLAILIVAIIVCILAVFIARLPVASAPIKQAASISLSESEPESVQSLGNPQPLNLSAHAALSVFLDDKGKMEVLVAKNAKEPLPIASITKLVTALTVLKNYELDKPVTVNSAAFVLGIDSGFLRQGDKFTVSSLLYPLLVESSNNAANVLALESDKPKFIKEMNVVAKEVGMKDSQFFNASGLDPQYDPGGINQASAYDLARLSRFLVEKHAKDILQITTLQGYQLFTSDGQFHHELKNTDKLLGVQNWPADIVGGKTGSTVIAKKNLLLILRDRQSGGYLINVVLGADDNFVDMKTLVDWVYASYRLT